MCQGDTALWTGKWVRTKTGELDYDADFFGQSRCADWEALQAWSRPRALIGKRHLRKLSDEHVRDPRQERILLYTLPRRL